MIFFRTIGEGGFKFLFEMWMLRDVERGENEMKNRIYFLFNIDGIYLT